MKGTEEKTWSHIPVNISNTLNEFTSHKVSQLEFVRYLLKEDSELGQRVRFCGSELLFRQWLQHDHSKLLKANFCGLSHLCINCAVHRVVERIKFYHPRIEKILQDHKKLIPAMVTLTIKNGPDLNERLAHLKSSWRSMIATARKARSLSGRHLPIEWNNVLGGIRSVEVTRNPESKEWHPHIHAFVLLNRYIDQQQLSREWNLITKDSFVVGLTKCKNGIVPGLMEVVKYSASFKEMSHQDRLELYYSSKGLRFNDSFGILRGVEIDELQESDPLGPYEDFLARWIEEQFGYKISKIGQLPIPPKITNP